MCMRREKARRCEGKAEGGGEEKAAGGAAESWRDPPAAVTRKTIMSTIARRMLMLSALSPNPGGTKLGSFGLAPTRLVEKVAERATGRVEEDMSEVKRRDQRRRVNDKSSQSQLG